MALLLDAGALLAVERGDRDILARIKGERVAGRPAVTHGGVVAQVWRGGQGRRAPLAIVLAGTEVRPLDDALGRSTGLLLGAAGLGDAIDAALMTIARDGDEILTSDVDDLTALALAARLSVEIIQV